MARTVFITRDLTADSVFQHRLLRAGFVVSGKSLIEFRSVAFAFPPAADWVFCYSSRAVEFFLRGLRQLGWDAGRYPRYAALGAGTAKQLEALGIQPAFVGDGNPEATALRFIEQAGGQRVLFPRAEQSRQSVQRLLEDQLEALDLIVYSNRKVAEAVLPDTDYAVLTSPLNAEAYFAIKEQQAAQRIVAIGHTTARALDRLQLRSYRIAEQATEADLAGAVIEWENE